MHTTALEEMTDSMRMFRWGLEGGRPEAGSIGAAPEWFYKGTGTILRARGEPRRGAEKDGNRHTQRDRGGGREENAADTGRDTDTQRNIG